MTLARVGVGAVGEQRLAEPALVVGDEVRGGAEDVRGRAVVALEPDDLGAGKILLEAEDVVDLGAAPAVDRLVVVADAADVLPALGEQPQPEILGDVGVLVLVDQHVAEAPVVVGEHVRVLAEDLQRLEEQVAEIGGVQRLQPVLVGGVELPPVPVGEGVGVGLRARPSGDSPRFFQVSIQPASWRAGQRFSSIPSAAMICFIRRIWSSVSRMVKSDLRPDQLGMAAQELGADRVERAEPLHAFEHAADQVADAVLHLARRLVGEGDGEDLAGPGAAGGEDMGDAGGEHAGLAGAGAGEHQHRPVQRLDREPLLGVQLVEVALGALPDPERARGDAARLRRGRVAGVGRGYGHGTGAVRTSGRYRSTNLEGTL